VVTETNAKATLHQRALHELKELAILAVYLYITLGAVIVMKSAALQSSWKSPRMAAWMAS
jgi:hypothetical protein